MTHIYGLFDPRDNRLRYIGKSDKPEHRLKEHLKDRSNCHRVSWIKHLKQCGLKPNLTILQTVPKDSWGIWERAWITSAELNGLNVVNLTNGGEGGGVPGIQFGPEFAEKIRARMMGNKNGVGNSPPASVRKKTSERFKGKKLSLEHRKKLSLAHMGNKSALGHKVSEDARRRMSIGRRGKPSSKKGIPLTDEVKKKISASKKGVPSPKRGLPSPLRGRKLSDEVKRKISDAKKGKPWTAAVRAAYESKKP